jgi:hypothetical protein
MAMNTDKLEDVKAHLESLGLQVSSASRPSPRLDGPLAAPADALRVLLLSCGPVAQEDDAAPQQDRGHGEAHDEGHASGGYRFDTQEHQRQLAEQRVSCHAC